MHQNRVTAKKCCELLRKDCPFKFSSPPILYTLVGAKTSCDLRRPAFIGAKKSAQPVDYRMTIKFCVHPLVFGLGEWTSKNRDFGILGC
ncbi:hypothetical protein JTE90_011997 [Oedothorax gibbosus]|uniref:Uncharacterized protein n=1 Tax=Oedothorax gibbosus TaxID=931172 RepID=A0AAV6URB4_9ARAC|nr:hypothetical protein JTE90_011997 [Oedothorax gibbosus]